jgi:hypothetical protein
MARNFYKPNYLSRLHKFKLDIIFLICKTNTAELFSPELMALTWHTIARSLLASPHAAVIWSITPHGAPTI